LNREYVAALTAADRFLQAWQPADSENGVALLTSHAKDAATTDVFDRFFSTCAPEAYEIARGQLMKHGRYEFPVVPVSGAPNSGRLRRRFSSIVIVNTGKNDWAVDKLP
jgi:nickel-dependent lactate racemase